MPIVKFGIPNGSLQTETVNLFEQAGYKITLKDRCYKPKIDDDEIELMLIRPQEIPVYVQRGVLDTGITGKDWLLERGVDVIEVVELPYAKQSNSSVKWVLAVRDDSSIQSAMDLEGKVIATELVQVTKRYLEKRGITARVIFSYGTTEAHVHLADAIVDLTETGASLRANNLRVVDVVLESSPRLIANQSAWEETWKHEKIERLSVLLQGVLRARTKVGMKMNVDKKNLPAVLNLLPALRKPTVANLSEDWWYTVEVVIERRQVRDLVPTLKKAGAEGVVVYPLDMVVL